MVAEYSIGDRLRRGLQELQGPPRPVADAGWPPPGRELEVIARIFGARPPEFWSRAWVEEWDALVLRSPNKSVSFGGQISHDCGLFNAAGDTLSAAFLSLRGQHDGKRWRFHRVDWHGLTAEQIRATNPDVGRRLLIEVGNLLATAGMRSVQAVEDLCDGKRTDLASVKQLVSEEAEACRLLSRFLRGLA